MAAGVRVEFEMAAERSAARPDFAAKTVEMIGFKTFSQIEVNLAGVILHQLFPAHAPGDGGGPDVGVASLGFEAQEFSVFGDVRSDAVTIAFLLVSHLLETELEAGDFASVDSGA